MIIIDVKYLINGKTPLYKSTHLDHIDDKDKSYKGWEFQTNNFVKDWFDCMRTIAQSEQFLDEETIIYSQSIYKFVTLIGLYDNAFFVEEINGEEKKGKLVYEFIDDAVLFFVPIGTTPTWEELKEMCK